MATNKELSKQNDEILLALHKLGNGEGIQGIKENLDDLKKDIHEIKEEIFNKQDSLRNRVTSNEKEVEYLKQKITKLEERLDELEQLEGIVTQANIRIEAIEMKLQSKSEIWSKAWLHILLVGLGFITIFVLERVLS